MKNITYINAGAGSGKTYTLTETLTKLIREKTVKPEQVILTTFTTKAANEFKEKAKASLFKEGMYSEAVSLDHAMIGTIHSVCQRMIGKYWFNLGLSPNMGVMAEEDTAFYISQSLAELPTEAELSLLHGFAEEFDIREVDEEFKIKNTFDYKFWERDLKAIIDFATNYEIDDFSASEQESLAFIRQFVTNNLDCGFSPDQIKAVIAEHEAFLRSRKESKTNNDRIDVLVKAKRSLHKPTIALLKSIAGTIGSPMGYGPLADDFKTMTEGIWNSRAVYDKQEAYIKTLFDLARRWKENFAQFKREKNVLDYNDMEKYMRLLMQDADVASEISQSYRYLFVDEFQDSSPIQVKIFDALSELMEHSYWVGDYKQAIYGFRGSDVALTKAVVDRITKESDGCDTRTLDTSYRSLPDIVELNNDIFCKTFANVLDQKNIHLKQNRKNDSKIDSLRYFQTTDEAGVAAHVLKLLNEGAEPNEIAVIARINNKLAGVANALSDLGIPSTRANASIIGSCAYILVNSLLRIVVSEKDSLAKATVALLTEENYGTKDIIEAKIIHDNTEGLEKGDYLSNIPLVMQTMDIRPQLMQQSISSMVESLIIELNLYDIIKTKESGAFSKMCFQIMINAAHAYESHCIQMNLPATVDGYLSYIEEMDPAGSGDTDGVQLHTYHSSKGLQWKYVILMSLNTDVADVKKAVKKGTYGVHVVHREEPSAENPYPDVYIRLTPWVYGTKSIPGSIQDRIETSESFRIAYKAMLEENNRTLYVGMTRPRDVMVLAIETGGRSKLLQWPRSQGVDTVSSSIPDTKEWDVFGVGRKFTNMTIDTSEADEIKDFGVVDTLSDMAINKPEAEFMSREPRYVSPSKIKGLGHADLEKDFNMRITFAKKPSDMAAVGDCIHQIFATIEESRPAYRIEMQETIESYGLAGVFDDTSLITSAWENLVRYLTQTYGPAVKTYHERPFRMEKDGQTIVGSIDLVWQTEEGDILIDFKTCPMGPSAVLDGTSSHYAGWYAGQLDAYEDALTAAGEHVIRKFIYYPVSGMLVHVNRQVNTDIPYPQREFHIFGTGDITPDKLWHTAKGHCKDDGFSGVILVAEEDDIEDGYREFLTQLEGSSAQGVRVYFDTTGTYQAVHLSTGCFASEGDLKLIFAYLHALKEHAPDCEIYYNDNIDEGQFALVQENMEMLFRMTIQNIIVLLENPAYDMDTGIPGAFREYYLPRLIDHPDMSTEELALMACEEYVKLQWNYNDYYTARLATAANFMGEEFSIRFIDNSQNTFIGTCQKVGITDSEGNLTQVFVDHFIDAMKGNEYFRMVDNTQFALDRMPEAEWDRICHSFESNIEDEELKVKPKVYLLRWNPDISSFRMSAYKDALKTYPDGFCMDWSIYEWEEARKGDKYYMLRVGEGNTGIVFHGEFLCDPYEGGDWAGKGKRRHYVDINCVDATDPDESPLVTMEQLKAAIPEIEWEKGHSGQLLTNEQALKIADLVCDSGKISSPESYIVNIESDGEEIEAFDLEISKEDAAAILDGTRKVTLFDFCRKHEMMFTDFEQIRINERLAAAGREDECLPPINADIEGVHFHAADNSWHLDVLIQDIGTVEMTEEGVEFLQSFSCHDLDDKWKEYEGLEHGDVPFMFYLIIDEVISHNGLK